MVCHAMIIANKVVSPGAGREFQRQSGLFAWGETICALRERLIPLGWERQDEQNWPLVVNRDGTSRYLWRPGTRTPAARTRMQ